MYKNGATVRADVGAHPLGRELRFFWKGELYFSRVFKDGDDALLTESEAKRQELLAKGWVEP